MVPASLNASLAELDPEVAAKIDDELHRQREGLEMIASENHTAFAVMQAQGSVLTNKYAEGYPHKRYYGGCATWSGRRNGSAAGTRRRRRAGGSRPAPRPRAPAPSR
ncbi:MAG: hypothetical protein J7474_11390, partial [Arthrobacter sp.]|nr:hypothetical protein [Arthrobacter sp.]